MQRLVLKPATGIASTLEALSILRHFEREGGREAFSSVQAFRDFQTKKHLGYIIVDVQEDVAEKLLSQGDHYVRTMHPTGYNDSSGPFVPSAYKCTLQDVINSMRLEGSASADKSTAGAGEKILQVSVEPASSGFTQRPHPVTPRIGNLPGQLLHRAPSSIQLRDLLKFFPGFSGKLGFESAHDT